MTECKCPTGCGTTLVKRKFVDVFDENGAVSLKDTQEDLYCQKCGIRWIAEQHNPLETEETKKIKSNVPIEFEQVTVKVPKQVMELLRFSESLDGMSPKEWIEYYTVETARSGIESTMFLPDPAELTKKFSLNPVFKEILDDAIEE